MVRLEVIQELTRQCILINFNSKMVRLEDGTFVGSALNPVLFQFQNGTIRRASQ